jgi:serine protease Do
MRPAVSSPSHSFQLRQQPLHLAQLAFYAVQAALHVVHLPLGPVFRDLPADNGRSAAGVYPNAALPRYIDWYTTEVCAMTRSVRSRKSSARRPAFRHPGNYFVSIAERAKKSVISIRAQLRSPKPMRTGSFFSPFFWPDEEEESTTESVGTGFIIRRDGYILTSEHVVHDAESIQVKLHNGSKYPAELVWSDVTRDIAVLRIHAGKPLRPLPLGSSAKTKVGELVISVGNPLGLEHTITTGVISAKNRQMSSTRNKKVYEDILQTDCAINPGNSGGPIINLNGQAIGMNAFVVKDNQGLGFAIGIDSIKDRIGRYLTSARRSGSGS